MSSTSEPLVSIVTPVYNEEKYLAECVESVLAQTYSNWQYTIVDNCSKDSSAEIAKRYAAKDRRITVHRNTEFLAAVPNFNHALRLISPASKYCKMVLGDDWIYPECVERMVTVAENHPTVGLVSAYALEGQRVTLTGLPYETKVVDGREACRRHVLDRLHIFGTQTSVLYRADLVRARERFFSELIEHGDTEICFDLLKESDLGFVHQVLTFTRVRPGSMYAQLKAMDTEWGCGLQILLNHGSAFLKDDELQSALDDLLSQYYRFLGKSLMMRRDKEFWDYHRTQLASTAIGYRRARVAAGLLFSIASAVLNPGRALSSLTHQTAPQRPDVRSTLLRT